jgi:hypothetical protein
MTFLHSFERGRSALCRMIQDAPLILFSSDHPPKHDTSKVFLVSSQFTFAQFYLIYLRFDWPGFGRLLYSWPIGKSADCHFWKFSRDYS